MKRNTVLTPLGFTALCTTLILVALAITFFA